MNNKHIERRATSLAIRELQIKIATKYHCPPVRTARIKNHDNVGEDAEKLDPGGNIKWHVGSFLYN